MFTWVFWKAAFERAVSTGAQFLVGLAGGDALGWYALDWGQIFIASAIGAGLSVAKSLATAAATDGSPSLTNAEKLNL